MFLTSPDMSALGLGPLARSSGYYPDPFNTIASQTLPRTLNEAHRWAERSVTTDLTMAQALLRVASYFVTDVEITAGTRERRNTGRADKEQFEEFMRKRIRIRSTLLQMAYEALVYGTVHASLEVPFRRLLSCKGCNSFAAPFAKVADNKDMNFSYDNASASFRAKCPLCRHEGPMRITDSHMGPDSDCHVRFWPVHDIEINHHAQSNSRQFIWNIPERDRRPVREGRIFHLERTPEEVLKAVATGNKILFNDDYIYQLKMPWLSGVDTAGWGIGRPLTAYQQSWYNRSVARLNESIALDHIAPFRVVTPEGRAGESGASSDPLSGSNMGLWKSQMRQMFRNHKRDPNGWHMMPFPIKYQSLGGDATQLAPFQLMDQGIDVLLNGLGVPAELYKGTLTMQAAPAALRLFESHWSHLVDALNGFLEWLVDRIAREFRWAPVDCKLTRVTHADDMNRTMAVLQLFMGRQISGTTAMKLLGENWEQEQVRMLEEQQFVADKAQEIQEEEQGAQSQKQLVQSQDPAQAALGGQQGGGGDPAQAGAGGPAPGGPVSPGAGSGKMTLQDLDEEAKQMAQEILRMPEGERRSQLSAIRQQDTTLHHLVTAYMEEERAKGASQGRQQVNQAAQQQGAKAARAPAAFFLRPSA